MNLKSLVVLALTLYGCAQMIPPAGGPPDTHPPQVVSVDPPCLTPVSGRSLKIQFNEPIQPNPEGKLFMVPQGTSFQIVWRFKKFFINFEDRTDLRELHLTMINYVQDVTEKNTMQFFFCQWLDTSKAIKIENVRVIGPARSHILGVSTIGGDEAIFWNTSTPIFITRDLFDEMDTLFIWQEINFNGVADPEEPATWIQASSFLSTDVPCLIMDYPVSSISLLRAYVSEDSTMISVMFKASPCVEINQILLREESQAKKKCYFSRYGVFVHAVCVSSSSRIKQPASLIVESRSGVDSVQLLNLKLNGLRKLTDSAGFVIYSLNRCALILIDTFLTEPPVMRILDTSQCSTLRLRVSNHDESYPVWVNIYSLAGLPIIQQLYMHPGLVQMEYSVVLPPGDFVVMAGLDIYRDGGYTPPNPCLKSAEPPPVSKRFTLLRGWSHVVEVPLLSNPCEQK